MNHTLTAITLATLAIAGLSSCAPPPASTGLNVQDSNVQNPTTQGTATQTGTIKIGGSSSAFTALKTLSAKYNSTFSNVKIEPLEPGQSENVISGIKQNIVDVGSISKVLKPEENDGTLESREVAHDGLVVATHPSVTGIKNLTTEHLKAIYSGTLTNWKSIGGPDAPIVVLDRPEDESAKRLLRKHYLGNDLPNSTATVILRKEGELIQTLESTPNSIGAFSLAHAIANNLPVNRLSLNGVEPTAENIKASKYPMIRSIVLVWHKTPSLAAQSLVQYIFSEPGKAVLEASGFVTISPRS